MAGSNETLAQTVNQLQQLLVKQQQELNYLRLAVEKKTETTLNSTDSRGAGRRRFLKSLAGLTGVGLAISALSSPTTVAAKFVGSDKAGALVVAPSTFVSGSLPSGAEYGLVSSARGSINLSTFAVNNIGIYGEGENFGVLGRAYGLWGGDKAGVGGIGEGENTTGVYGLVNGQGSVAVLGVSTNSANVGVRGTAIGANSWGIHGISQGTNGVALVGHGAWSGVDATGVFYGIETRATDPLSYGINATGGVIGVRGQASDAAGRGLYGEGYVGVEGFSNSSATASAGVYGRGGNYAGFFNGATAVLGSFVASSKNFRIDHPQNPANQYLQHASIESDQMLNLYSGNLTLDNQGRGKVSLPNWFELLNHSFSYQLTSLGASSPLFIAAEIKNGQFEIAGGLPGQRVCWLVTGVRQDAWAKANPLEVEKAKPGLEQGTYLHPELYGQTVEKTLLYRPAPVLPTKKS